MDNIQEHTSVDKLVEVYIKIRDAKEEVAREAKKKEQELEEQLATIEAEILAVCKQTDADSIKTKHGTAMRSVKSRFTTKIGRAHV